MTAPARLDIQRRGGAHGPLLAARGVSRKYRARGERGLTVLAVDDISFDVNQGETLGVVGESGSGKSTLARMLVGLERADSGRIEFRGSALRLEDKAQMRSFREDVQIIFQDPYSSLNPQYTVQRALSEVLTVHGMSDRRARSQRVAELLDLVGLPQELGGRHPRELSGGQRQRVVIARALAVEPVLLVADEPVSAVDVSVQAQILNLFSRLQDELGLTYVFISHDLDVVHHICDRVLVVYLGRVVEEGPTDQVWDNPMHPYSRALLAALPSIEPGENPEAIVSGELPNPLHPPPGCHFHPRCPYANDHCRAVSPELISHGSRKAACHLVRELDEVAGPRL